MRPLLGSCGAILADGSTAIAVRVRYRGASGIARTKRGIATRGRSYLGLRPRRWHREARTGQAREIAGRRRGGLSVRDDEGAEAPAACSDPSVLHHLHFFYHSDSPPPPRPPSPPSSPPSTAATIPTAAIPEPPVEALGKDWSAALAASPSRPRLARPFAFLIFGGRARRQPSPAHERSASSPDLPPHELEPPPHVAFAEQQPPPSPASSLSRAKGKSTKRTSLQPRPQPLRSATSLSTGSTAPAAPPPMTAAATAAEPAAAPPSRQSLKTWWQHFTSAQKVKKGPEKDPGEHPVFGKPLKESLKYASVQISTANANGELYVWGYIPVVVAKCGLFLKENATEVEGTFRVSGSNKRMRELQAIFETPPRYGKSLDWKKENYTPHDVASVFRRYLTQMPEPVIPHDLYHQFRDAISKKPYNQDDIIATYKRLIASMPRANQYLLLYVLDLLSVFSRKAEKNLMTAANLAVIFRPGIMSHPDHELSPREHQLSQEVLEFLIAHQDWFMLTIPPPPPANSGAPHSQQQGNVEVDEAAIVSSSDDERATGGWKLVHAHGQKPGPGSPAGEKKIARRRTTTERERGARRGFSHGPGAGVDTGAVASAGAGAPMTPVPESPRSSAHGAPLGVARSRTLPSASSRSDRSAEEERRVLRKARRESAAVGEKEKDREKEKKGEGHEKERGAHAHAHEREKGGKGRPAKGR